MLWCLVAPNKNAVRKYAKIFPIKKWRIKTDERKKKQFHKLHKNDNCADDVITGEKKKFSVFFYTFSKRKEKNFFHFFFVFRQCVIEKRRIITKKNLLCKFFVLFSAFIFIEWKIIFFLLSTIRNHIPATSSKHSMLNDVVFTWSNFLGDCAKTGAKIFVFVVINWPKKTGRDSLNSIE